MTLARTAVAVALAVGAALVPGTAAADVGDEWGKRADAAIAEAIRLDNGTGNAWNYSWLASGIAHRHGWDDPRAKAYLTKALGLGYGVGKAWDAFGDGTTNPASTAYTVTLAGHVGPVVLEAWQASAVPLSTLTGLLDKLYQSPRVPGLTNSATGYCVAYSHHPNDVKPGYCVHNVNAGVAAFLQQVEDAGVTHRLGDSRWWRAAITRVEVAAYRHVDRSWRYVDFRTGLNDGGHNGYSVESAMEFAEGIGGPALAFWMVRDMGKDSWLGHLHMARWDCAGSARWLGEYDANIGGQPFFRQAQVARFTGLLATVC